MRASAASGLTDSEAWEFHSIFVTSFLIFVAITIVAHVLVWQWRPWLPGKDGYAFMLDGIAVAKSFLA